MRKKKEGGGLAAEEIQVLSVGVTITTLYILIKEKLAF